MIKNILKSDFIRNVSVLISGTLLAQLIPILITPILARIYTPDDFGFYGFYLSIVGIMAMVYSGRYHMALFVSKNKLRSIIILKSTIIFTLVVSIITSLIVLSVYILSPTFSMWYLLLGLIVLFSSLVETFSVYANILSKYKLMSVNMIVRSIIANIFFIILGFLKFGKDGLMIGLLLGQIVQIIHYLKYFSKDLMDVKLSLRIIIITLKQYKNFLLHSSTSAFLNNLSIQLPTFFLKKYYNIGVVGQYFQSYKLLTLPNSFIARAFGSVFAQNAAEKVNKGISIDDIVISLYKKLVFISFIPFSLLAIYGDRIMVIVLGEQWEVAGKFAQIIAPWVYINFIVLPFTYLFEIYIKQKNFSYFNFALLFFRLLSLFIGFYYNDVYLSVLLFSLSSFIIYGLMLVYLFRLSEVKGVYNYIMFVIYFSLMTIVLYSLSL